MADLLRGPVTAANLTAAAGVTTTVDGWWPCLDITFRTPVPASITKIVAQVRERGTTAPVAETVLTSAEIAAGAAKIVNGVSVGQHLEVRLAPAGAPGLPFQPTPWLEVTTSWDALMAALGREPNPAARPTPDLGRGYAWTKKSQIIQRGGSGSWKQSLVEVPTVFWDPKLGKYRMLFDGYTGAPGSPSVNAIGYATSDDLETWTEYGSNPFFQRTSSGGDPDQNGVGQPFVFYEDGTYYLFYVGRTATFGSGTQSICLATSTDFATWTRHGSVVTKQAATWRSAEPARPCVVKRGAVYYMFFHSGLTGGIGYATSADLLTWSVDDVNSPLVSPTALAWDSSNIGDISIYRVQDTWYGLYYAESSSHEQKMGIVFTSDEDFPLGWTKFSGNPVLVGTPASYDAGGAARGGVVQAGSRLFLFYTAADVASNGPSAGSAWSIAYAVDETLAGGIGGSTGANDNRLIRADGVGGKTIQASAIAVDDSGGIIFPANLQFTGKISPTQITSNQNDYNPTSLATAVVLRLNSDASRDVTGLQGGADGRVLVLANVGSFNIVLKDESGSSTAGNRFALDGDLTLGADTTATLLYDSTSSRWRLIATGKTAGGGGGSGTVTHTNGVLTSGRLIIGAGTDDVYIGLTDVTTDNVSTSAHGLVPKAPNDLAKFLRGDGSWASTSGIAGVAPYAYTHPPFANVSALLHFDGTNGSTTITDVIGGTWTAVGTAAISTAQSVFGGASLLVPGSGNSSVKTTTSSAFDVGSGDWALEFRWRYNGAPQSFARVFATRDGDTNQGIALTIDSASILSINMSTTGSSADLLPSQAVVTLSQSAWYSVILQRRGIFAEVFINGTLIKTYTIGGSSIYYNSGDTIVIGGNATSTSRSMNAYIDEFRFTKGAYVMGPGDPGLPTSALPNS